MVWGLGFCRLNGEGEASGGGVVVHGVCEWLYCYINGGMNEMGRMKGEKGEGAVSSAEWSWSPRQFSTTFSPLFPPFFTCQRPALPTK